MDKVPQVDGEEWKGLAFQEDDEKLGRLAQKCGEV